MPRPERQTGGPPLGIVTTPRAQKGGIIAAEVKLTSADTLALGGPMVPRAAFPPEAERSGLPHFKVGANGFVDTGYCVPLR
jgi:hypothetical protein